MHILDPEEITRDYLPTYSCVRNVSTLILEWFRAPPNFASYREGSAYRSESARDRERVLE